MNGVHDMGGMTCFGPVESEADEPVFHHEWERRVFALSVAMGGMFGPIDTRRYLVELLDPAFYLESTYYERWLARLDGAVKESGLLTEEEIVSGVAMFEPAGEAAAPDADTLRAVIREGKPVSRDTGRLEPRFHVGEAVRARNINPSGHTRLPRYARGRVGVVEACHGIHVFPDSNAHGEGENPQPLYNVRFAATELWGPEASARDAIFLDLWEDHLQSLEERAT
jgi:nitrile hydratase